MEEVFFLLDEIQEKNTQELNEILKLLKHPSLQKETYVLRQFTKSLLQSSSMRKPIEFVEPKKEVKQFVFARPSVPMQQSAMHYQPSIPRAPVQQFLPAPIPQQAIQQPSEIPPPVPKPEIHEEKEPLDENYDLITDIETDKPLASVNVKYDYKLKEPELYEPDKLILGKLKEVIGDDAKKVQDRDELQSLVKKHADKLKIPFAPELYTKMKYYLTRDVVNLGKLEPLLRDLNVDKIKCHGYQEPIKVAYKNKEMITDVRFESEKELHDYLVFILGKTNPNYDKKEKMFDYTFLNLRFHIELGSEMTSSKVTITKQRES